MSSILDGVDVATALCRRAHVTLNSTFDEVVAVVAVVAIVVFEALSQSYLVQGVRGESSKISHEGGYPTIWHRSKL